MKNYFTAFLIFLIFAGFVAFVYSKKSTNLVLDILTPTTIQVDLNSNRIFDDGETICIPNLESFSTEFFNEKFSKELNITPEESFALGYLAEEYSRNLLLSKQVKVKLSKTHNSNCQHGEIFVDGENYSQRLYNLGLAKWNGVFNKVSLDDKIETARKLNLVILNLKSNKYHKTDCEYGIKSTDYIITPIKQVPEDAKPCKFCHIYKNKNQIDTPGFYSSYLSDGGVKLILTDFTQKMRPDKKCQHEVCKSLLKEIQNTHSTIDMAIYGWDNIDPIKNALIDAKNRGVKIRLVYDETSEENYYYKDTPFIINLADESMSDKNDYSTTLTDMRMHNKFVIFDNKKVMTGSMNFSSTGLSGFNTNTILFINAKDVANLYTAEFEQMLSGKFHDRKRPLGLNNSFKVDNSNLSVYFSPYDKAAQKIIELIEEAKHYIYIPTFLITHKDLTNALIKAKQSGIDVKIIMDANSVGTNNTTHVTLRENKIPLKTENYAGKMHSKSIIIDDKYIIVGSMNFSNSGEHRNDENTVIIRNEKLAKFYKSFFTYLWDKIPNTWLYQNARPESLDSIGSCYDRIDNDYDGQIDNADSGCK